jgi:hypothetical protein
LAKVKAQNRGKAEAKPITESQSVGRKSLYSAISLILAAVEVSL